MGMILIVVSWIAQIISMLKGDREITKGFAFLQTAGIALITAGLISTNATVGALNLISALGAACVLVLLLIKK